jgi:L-amino acid N-acyltransferase YncA
MRPSEDYMTTIKRLVADGPFERSVPLTVFVDRRGRRLRLCRYGVNDFEPLLDMYRTLDEQCASQGLPPRGDERLRPWLTHLTEEGFNLIAKDWARVVGHANVMKNKPDAENATQGELALFVHQDYQGAGLGTKLLTCLVAISTFKGYRRLWALVDEENRPIIEVNRKLGFQTLTIIWGEREMELRLQSAGPIQG